MDLVILLLSVVALFAVGVGITLSLARHIPLHVLACSEQHGRFAHLGAGHCSQPTGPARTVRAQRPAAHGLVHGA